MKHVFYITESGIYAYDGDAFNHAIEFFGWKEIGEVEHYITTIPSKSAVHIVIDLVDEDLSFEWSPKVHFWEKKVIRQRRVERIKKDSESFVEVKWTGITRQNIEGRSEELLMIANFTDSYDIHSFIQSLEEAQLSIRGIHSKALLLEKIFKEKVCPYLKLSRQQVNQAFMLVTRESEFVFRQTFLVQGQLRLNRLIEVQYSNNELNQLQSELINEIKLAVNYVYTQKFVPFNSPISYVFMDDDDELLHDIETVRKKEGLILSSWAAEKYLFATVNYRKLAELGSYSSINSISCFSQQMVVDFLFANNLPSFYQTPYQHKINYLIIGRQALIGLNVVVFLGGVYYVLITGLDSLVSWQKQSKLEQKILEYQVEKDRLQNAVKLQADSQQIKASVEFSEAILELKVNRLISFDVNAISKVFAKHSQHIQLANLNWKKLEYFDSGSTQIDIQAWVYPFYDTYYKPVTWVDSFVSDLKKVAGIESVQLQKEPLNRQLKQSLTINTAQDEVNALPFTISLRIKDDLK